MHPKGLQFFWIKKLDKKFLLVVVTACPSVPVAAGVIVFIITVLVVGPLRTSASWRTTGGGGRLICPCSSCVVIGSCCGGGRGCGSSIISQKCHAAGSIGRWPNTVVVGGDVFNRASWPAGRVRLTWKISSYRKLKISFQVLRTTW